MIELNHWEMHFIVVLKSKVPYGYNQTDGGEGAAGCIVTQETRDKKSAKLRGRKASPKTCAKLSVSKTGKFPPPETCVKMSEAQRGEKSHNYGRAPAPEVSSKIAKKNRGKTPFQNLLRELEAHNLSYHGLAKLMGIAYTTVSAKMLGRLNFTAKDAAKLEAIFGKSAEYLLKRDENCAEPAKVRREDSPYKNLLKELDARNLSYRRFAELLGLSHALVARKIRGERNFTVKDKIKLIELFQKPIEYLLARDDG